MPTYQSFSGSDIIATFGGRVIGELLQLTYSSTREKAPTYTLGHSAPRGFARGRRGISGSLVLAVFDRNALLEEMRYAQTRGGRDVSQFQSFKHGDTFIESDPDRAVHDQHKDETWQPNTFNDLLSREIENNKELLQEAVDWNTDPVYADQLQPFNITVNAANETGARAKFTLVDVEIMNEGMGVGIEDLAVSQEYTFVARDMQPLHSEGKDDMVKDQDDATANQTKFQGGGGASGPQGPTPHKMR